MYYFLQFKFPFAMAPAKKKTSRRKNTVKNEKLASFLKDFDSEVKSIVEQLKANVTTNLKEVDSLYNIEILKQPLAIREMCWINFFAKGGSERALEAAAMVNLDSEEINQITSCVSQTPFKSAKQARKRKKDSSEDRENIPERSVLRAKTTAKKVPVTKKTRVSAANPVGTAKRTSKRARVTPSNKRSTDTSLMEYTSMVTPKIDTRLFKTPALRTPGMREPVYTFSANGSPLACMDELFINVPVGKGKNVRLTADEADNVDLSNIDQQSFENIKLLSRRLEKICKTIKSK